MNSYFFFFFLRCRTFRANESFVSDMALLFSFDGQSNFLPSRLADRLPEAAPLALLQRLLGGRRTLGFLRADESGLGVGDHAARAFCF